MPKGIVWSNEMRELARKRGTALFAYGYQKVSGRARGGAGLIAHTPTLTEGEAACLALFLIDLTANRKPLDRCVAALKQSLKNCTKRGGIKDA